MFELGARPHPPRELYRAYLEQSDVFVGVYWQQYGWIAPGEEISGLEDEYRLAPREMPKLIYVKQPAEREERLAGLMSRIRDDDTASYTSFSTADELAELVEADLATLLAERFDASRAVGLADAGATDAGRQRARRPDASRAVHRGASAARATSRRCSRGWATTIAAPRHPRRSGRDRQEPPRDRGRTAGEASAFDRVTFVTLEHVRDDAEVLPAIARELGVREHGDRPLVEQLAVARAGRRDLIVLDNFEQVLRCRGRPSRRCSSACPTRRSS